MIAPGGNIDPKKKIRFKMFDHDNNNVLKFRLLNNNPNRL